MTSTESYGNDDIQEYLDEEENESNKNEVSSEDSTVEENVSSEEDEIKGMYLNKNTLIPFFLDSAWFNKWFHKNAFNINLFLFIWNINDNLIFYKLFNKYIILVIHKLCCKIKYLTFDMNSQLYSFAEIVFYVLNAENEESDNSISSIGQSEISEKYVNDEQKTYQSSDTSSDEGAKNCHIVTASVHKTIDDN